MTRKGFCGVNRSHLPLLAFIGPTPFPANVILSTICLTTPVTDSAVPLALSPPASCCSDLCRDPPASTWQDVPTTVNNMTQSVLFVCLGTSHLSNDPRPTHTNAYMETWKHTGNICRSPLAEAVFQHLVNQRELGDLITKVDSAGTAGYHVGELPDERCVDVPVSLGREATGC